MNARPGPGQPAGQSPARPGRWVLLLLAVLAAHLALLDRMGTGGSSALIDMGPVEYKHKVVLLHSVAPSPAAVPARRAARKPKAKAPPQATPDNAPAPDAAPDAAPIASADAGPDPAAAADPAVPEAAETDRAAAAAPASTASAAAAAPDQPAAPAGAAPDPAQASAGTANPETWPTDSRLSYRVDGYYRGDVSGDARVLWQRAGRRYQARIEISLGFVFGSYIMTSQGDIAPEGLHPDVFEEQSRMRRRQLTLGAQEIVLDDGRRLARPARVQDTISQFIEFSHRFMQGEYPARDGAHFSVMLARPGGLNEWTYDVSGPEPVEIPGLGPQAAWHLRPRPPPNPLGPINAELWLAPALQYLPVRIRLHLNEQAWLDLRLEQIEQR